MYTIADMLDALKLAESTITNLAELLKLDPEDSAYHALYIIHEIIGKAEK
jgi:hypothetical protein